MVRSRRASGSSRRRVAKRGARELRQTRRPSVRNKELLHFTRTTRRRDYQSDISLLRSKWDSDGLSRKESSDNRSTSHDSVRTRRDAIKMTLTNRANYCAHILRFVVQDVSKNSDKISVERSPFSATFSRVLIPTRTFVIFAHNVNFIFFVYILYFLFIFSSYLLKRKPRNSGGTRIYACISETKWICHHPSEGESRGTPTEIPDR